MRSNRPDFNTILSGSALSGSFFVSTKRGIPFLPGVMLIALGIVVLVAPRLVLGAIALFLLALGGLFCYVTYKIIALRRQINTMAKNFEGSLYGSLRGSGMGGSGMGGSGAKGSPFSDKPDIDITDFENSKKIVYH